MAEISACITSSGSLGEVFCIFSKVIKIPPW